MHFLHSYTHVFSVRQVMSVMSKGKASTETSQSLKYDGNMMGDCWWLLQRKSNVSDKRRSTPATTSQQSYHSMSQPSISLKKKVQNRKVRVLTIIQFHQCNQHVLIIQHTSITFLKLKNFLALCCHHNLCQHLMTQSDCSSVLSSML